MCTSGIMYEEEFLEDGVDDVIITKNNNTMSRMNPWEALYEPYKNIYTKEEINKMTLEEIQELYYQLEVTN